MKKDTFGLILCGNEHHQLRDLTFSRSAASVPFGGRYRIIDFVMSNMVNSDLTDIGVVTERNYSSLMDHLGSGAPWDLNRKHGGLFILPPFNSGDASGMFRGTIDAMNTAMDFIEHMDAYRYCVLQHCNAVFNMTFTDMIQQHIDTNADITCLYCTDPPQRTNQEELIGETRFMLEEGGRIVDIEIDARRPLSPNLFLETIVIERQLLMYLVNEAHGRNAADFTRDVMQSKLSMLNIYGYKFNGYVGKTNTVETFFESNLDILNQKISNELFDRENRIYTKVKNEVPALYRSSASAKNCMVADGCIIEGEIENCVLSRSVTIGKGSRVKNCVIMQGSEIQENVELENVILDKNVTIRRGRRLIGAEGYPIVVRKLAVI